MDKMKKLQQPKVEVKDKGTCVNSSNFSSLWHNALVLKYKS